MADRDTPYGTIHYGGSCRDDYDNIEVWDQPPAGGAPIKLQRPALRALRAAERRVGKPIYLTGSWRSCSFQRELWLRDPNRYAHPDVGVHTRGLAIDVSTNQSARKRRKIARALAAEGWVQVRPDDEPWHWSFVVKA